MVELVEWKREMVAELMEPMPKVVVGFATDKRRTVASEEERSSSEILEERTVGSLGGAMVAKEDQAVTTTREEAEVANLAHPKSWEATV